MKNPKNRFQVGDSIEQLRYNDVIRKGKVVKGPFRVEGVDHYHVEWWWHDETFFGKDWVKNWYREVDLIADLRSTKYSYRKGRGLTLDELEPIMIRS